jgi:hypothetical protein
MAANYMYSKSSDKLVNLEHPNWNIYPVPNNTKRHNDTHMNEHKNFNNLLNGMQS